MCKIIEQVIDGTLTIDAAGAKLGVSTRTIRRRCHQYLYEGPTSFAHKSRGRTAHNKYSTHTRTRVIELYLNKYQDYNFTHFWQKITEVEGVVVSHSGVYRILTEAGVVSPRSHRVRKESKLHPSRPRRACFGELLQMDASKHIWFADEYVHLHAAIDDASGTVTGAHFEKEETLHGYFQVMSQTLKNFGIPESLYTDRRTIFGSTQTKSSNLSLDTSTQFRVAASKLGIASIYLTSVPQAKGRIERLFNTLQDRLIVEMRSSGINTVEQANDFLPAFIADHNRRYALSTSELKSAFGPTMMQSEINLALSIVNERIVHSGGTISFKGQSYAFFDKNKRVNLSKGTKVIVLKSLDGLLYAVHENEMWTLLKSLDNSIPTPKDVKDSVYIPPKESVWKEGSYRNLIKKYRRAG